MAESEISYPRFTQDMKKTHRILIPNMAPIHFGIMHAALELEGYQAELLGTDSRAAAREGLRYVHNDTCYPALLVIGQFIDALKSGRYDPEHTALLITQTGGGCRASNYIYLLRKALVKAGFAQVPVASLNFSGLEKDSGFRLTPVLLQRMLASVLYGDELMCLSNQIRPYENHAGDADALVGIWTHKIADAFRGGHGVSRADLARNFAAIAADFASVPVTRTPKVKVGIVGEIYVKYSPLGNNELEKFLRGEDCEINLPGLLGFLQYCVSNVGETIHLYGGSRIMAWGGNTALQYLNTREQLMIDAIRKYPSLRAPSSFSGTRALADGVIGLGAKMGEGWLLTAEMMELEQTGFENIICAQPFGCLPNHISGKGMINRIRSIYPNANITPIDYDPGATRVNQENRIKLMLSVARERLAAPHDPPCGGESIPLPVYGQVECPPVSVPGFGEKLPAGGTV